MGGNQFTEPGLVGLTGDRVLLAYSILDPAALTYTIAYEVMDSDGASLRGNNPPPIIPRIGVASQPYVVTSSTG